MSSLLIILVTAIYFFIGVDFMVKGSIWAGVIWWGYCIANIGLYKTLQ